MAVKRKGLGKGLSALIEEDLEDKLIDQNGSKEVQTLAVSEIEPNREQPRKHFNEDALNELADSIKQYGIIQPLIVIKKDEYYEIVAGERRWRAAKIAGIKEVPVVIKDYALNEILAISLIENIQRENLNPIEEAVAYKKLLDEYNLRQDDVAEKVSKSRSSIANTMRLLNLDDRIQQMIIDEMISSGHARTLLALEDGNQQYELAVRIFDEKLNVRETEQLIKRIKSADKPQKPKSKSKDFFSPVYKDIEKSVEELLGTKVQIHRKSDQKGMIEISYFSNQELDRIVELIKSVKVN